MSEKIKFKDWDCTLLYKRYGHNNQVAIILLDAETRETIAIATSCLDKEFEDNETAIKDYTENEGMLRTLIDAGIVTETGKTYNSGFADFPIVTVNDMSNIQES